MLYNKEVIQRFQSAYSLGVQSKSSRLTNRHIFSVVSSTRSTILSQEAKKGQRLSEYCYQTLPCVELIEVPLNECPCTPQTGCMILRSKYKIPAAIATKSCHILSVTALEGRMTLGETTLEEKEYQKGRKYTSQKPDFFFRDGYIYITVTMRLETLTIRGVFENPIAAYRFPNKCGDGVSNCISNLDFVFPYEEDLVGALVDLAAREFGGFKPKEDRRNDSADGIEAQ